MAIRVGVWGAGAWGEKHARVYAASPAAELVGIYDRSAERTREIAARHGVRAFEHPEALLAACAAVSIAVPTVAHREALERAAAASVHALVEKPMAPTVEDADAMIAAARRGGIMLQIGHVERFNPALLAAGLHLGGLKFIEAHRLALFQPRSLDIDVVFDLMIHDIDIVLDRVAAPPTQISAVGVAVLSENEDIANARLEFADGCVANLTASRVSQDRLRRIRFFQDDAYVSVDLLEKSCERLQLDRTRLTAEAPLEAIRRERTAVTGAEPLTLELEAFLASLAGRGTGAASAAAGRAALQVAAEVRAAMKRRSRQWTVGSPGAS